MSRIYLYGEIHNVKKIKDKEFELWCEYYHNENIRHLFVEKPYYSAEFLNIWMQSDNDEMLNKIRKDLIGTPTHSQTTNEFLKGIKRECPK